MAFSSWIRNWKRSLERRWALYQTLRRAAVARRRASRPRLEALEDRWLLSIYIVTSAADDGRAGTLRDAINQANLSGSTITEIDFNIGTPGTAQTISLTSQLPSLTASGVFINGLSQGGISNATPLITLDGSGAGSSSDGLLLQASGDIVSGLIIEHFNNGIEVAGSSNTIGGTTTGAGNILSGNADDGVLIDSAASSVLVAGNFIGTNAAGSAALANSIGIEVGGNNNTIGGTTSGSLNVISGNSTDGVLIDSTASGVQVQGNYIGTDVTGAKAVANVSSDVTVNGSNNTIGGTATGARNVISGSDVGVTIYASGVQVQGNYIGTNAAGNAAVANFNGVVAYSSSNTIGGTAAGARNVISGNRYEGVVIDGSGVQVQGNYIGTDVTGTTAVANGTLGGFYGIFVGGSSNTIGGSVANAANILAHNAGGGVYVSTGYDNTIRLNSISANGSTSNGHGPGITLNNGNNNLAAPSLTSTSTSQNTLTVTGSFTPPTANVSYILDFYANSSADAEGKVYLGSLTVTPTSTNSQSFTFTTATSVTSKYPLITATLTDASGNTSEFSNGVPVDKYKYLVTSTADDGSAGTLRDAINQANAPGRTITEIDFNIGTSGTAQTTDLTGALPTLTASGVYINGLSQGGSGNTTQLIELNGSGAGSNNDGLLLQGSNCTVSGLIIEDFSQHGIVVGAANNVIGGTTAGAGNVISGNTNEGVFIESGISGVAVQGNYIGTDVTGTQSVANSDGIEVAGSNNTIGGTTSGARNIISGNLGGGVTIDSTASGVLVQGNYIGTDATGTKAVGNGVGIEVVGSSNTIGGTAAGAGNVISGNSSCGVALSTSGVTVQGNYIGTDATGTKAIGNSVGIEVVESANTVGGTASGAGNVISGNTSYGVWILASGVNVQGNFIGTNLTGASALANSVGVEVAGSSSTIGGTASGAGNVISGNTSYGVALSASGVTVQGNCIGTDATGAKAIGNGVGIEVESANTIGGTASGAGNVISGNSSYGVWIPTSGVTVQGNFIGTDATGTSALANGVGVEVAGSSSTIGGTSTGAGNVISGNSYGVALSTSGVTVQGNYIGTDATGTKAVGNSVGVDVAGSSSTIGGTATGASNVISGNSSDGVYLTGTHVTVQGNYIGTDFTGAKAVGNSNGVEIHGDNEVLGGTIAAARNIISGNTNDGVLIDIFGGFLEQVQGNYIGTDATGTKAVGNKNGVEVDAWDQILGGTASGTGNVISGNANDGVLIDNGVFNVLVQGNYIGTDATGVNALGNYTGVYAEGSYNTIGGSSVADRNVISGNTSWGVNIAASGVRVQGNYIGTDVSGAIALGNGYGVEVDGTYNSIGGTSASSGNLIANNTQGGVLVNAGSGNTIRFNSIFANGSSNTGPGISLSNGGNNDLAAPSLASATLNVNVLTVMGSFTPPVANVSYVLDFYANLSGDAEGKVYLGSETVTPTSTSSQSFIFRTITSTPATYPLITATLNDASGDTSSFSNGVTATILPPSSVYVVTSTADDDSTGTLRDAVNQANAAGSTITLIDFNIGTSGTAQAINLTSQLPALTANDVVVDGLSQGGSGNTTQLITLNGTNAGSSSDGLLLQGADGTVWGLILEDFGKNGIEVDGANNTVGGTMTAAGNILSANKHDGLLIDSGVSGVQVQGNYIGTDITGSTAVANTTGVEVAGSNNTIGGTAVGDRNIISGNSIDGVLIDSGASGVTVQGNYIGTDSTGSKFVANGSVAGNEYGIEVAGSNNTIGGTTSGALNVISANKADGVLIDSNVSGVQVQGNYIGTNAAGSAALPNSVGIEVAGSNNTIGGTTGAARNIISGNFTDGVALNSGVSGVQVQGNYIGTDPTGSNAVGPGTQGPSYGIDIEGSNNTIGGTATGARNVISGIGYGEDGSGVFIDASGVMVQGNYIGTDATGSKFIGSSFGIYVDVNGSNNTIGGTTTGAGNIISGNFWGVYIISSGVIVQGNYIGTDVTGTQSLGNNYGVVDSVVAGAANVTIGGASAAARNIISGNRDEGVALGPSGVTVQGNYIGTDVTGTKAIANNIGIHITGGGNTIGGTVTSAGNLISGNTNEGVLIDYLNGVQLEGNYIGTDVTGTKALANNIGIQIVGGSGTIGGTAAGAGNIISGNADDGVLMGSSGIALQGNYIGTDVTGTKALANSVGIQDSGNNDTLGGSVKGAGNIISGNSGDGVLLDSTSSGETVEGNYIGLGYKGQLVIADGSNGVEVQGSNNIVGGNSGSNYYVRNFISGNTGDGLLIDSGATANQVLGNFIGLDVSGTNGVGNSIGVEVAGNRNTVGGTSVLGTNFISGNKNDGLLLDSTASSNLIQGNDVGTDYAGRAPVANGGNGIEVMGNGNTLGGTTTAARNVISGNDGDGVKIDSGVSGTLIQGNFIGLNAIDALGPNAGNGITIAGTNNTIGGTTTATRNYISGNSGDGVLLDSSASGNVVLGNFLGVNLFSNAAANSNGIEVAGTQNTIGGSASGAFNVLSGNKNDGVLLDSAASGNVVLGNSVGLNVYGTVAVGNSIGIEVAGTHNTLGASYAVAPNAISGNSKDGVLLDGTASGNQVLGNYIGTNRGGTVALANQVGIEDAGSSNTIGGSVLGARNVISGNTSDGVLLDSTATAETMLGNYIGLSVGGNTILANGSNGIEVQGSNNTLGGNSGTNYFVRNFVSGNTNDGVLMDSGAIGNQVLGNFIGVGISGTNGVGNVANGIEIVGSNNTLGGTSSGTRNIISGNGDDGVLLASTATSNLMQDSYVGTDYKGQKAVANSSGIEIQGNGNTVGGAAGSRNVISGNSNDGVLIDSGASANLVLGNYIGVNTYDTAVVGNSGNGIEIAGSNNTIGASYAVAPNEISGNTVDGVLLDSNSSGNVVLGNYIGTNHGGTAAVANKVGIEDAGSSNTLGDSVLGARNVISGNSGDGVLLDSSATAETMQGNYIGLNVSGNAALANGSNGVEVQGSNNIIGGNSGSNYFTRNFLSGNTGDGLLIDNGASGNQVLGNFIGVGVSGTNGVGNSIGIEVAGNSNTLGGASFGLGNVISGNSSDGIRLDRLANNNVVQRNDVGTDYTGKNAVGNSGNGLTIIGNDNTVGGSAAAAGNTIAYNSGDGVLVSVGAGNTITSNSIFANTAGGISLSNGGNNNVAAPSLLTAVLSGSTLTVTGSFTAPAANVSYVLQFFANPSGDTEGKIYLGSLTVTPTSTGTQNFTFTTTTSVTGTYPLITATLTDNTADTSAFSSGVTTTLM